MDGMLERIPSTLFDEWLAYFNIEPFGEMRAELRNGLLCSIIANTNRDPKKIPTPFKTIDFMHYLRIDEHKKDKQSVEEMKDIFKALATETKSKRPIKKKG